jgi:hypothetical protein
MNDEMYRLNKKHKDDLDRIMREAREDMARSNQEFKDQLKEFDSALNNARILSRDVTYKIIVLCTSIIGFSLALISTNILSVSVDVYQLRISWYLFLTTIICGFASLFIEGRIHYVLGWRGFQVQEFDSTYRYKWYKKIMVFFVAIYSLISPRNLIFCRAYKSEAEKLNNGYLNAKTIQLLAEWEKLTFLTENIFIISFVAALYVFITSYK